MLYGLLVLVIIGTIVWMGVDAYHAGRSWGSIAGWVLGAVLLWIVAFPCYLVSRRHFDEATDLDDDGQRAPEGLRQGDERDWNAAQDASVRQVSPRRYVVIGLVIGLVIGAAAFGGYYVGHRQPSIPNSWIGRNGDTVYWAAWTQTGDQISGTWTEGERGCVIGGVGTNASTSTSAYAMIGVLSGESITVRIDYGSNTELDYNGVGRVTANQLALPSEPILHPGSQGSFNALVRELPAPTGSSGPPC